MDIKKVLLVDDDRNIRLISQIGLEGVPGWDIFTAESGLDALTKAADNPPDVILLDMMMPGMDGIATYNKLKENEHTAAIPVIFMTAKVQNDEMDSYMKLGAAGVITKPFDPMTLSSDIIRLLNSKKVSQNKRA